MLAVVGRLCHLHTGRAETRPAIFARAESIQRIMLVLYIKPVIIPTAI